MGNALFSMSCTSFFFLWVDFLLNFDHFQLSGTFLDLFGNRVEYNFAPSWIFWSGFESSHNKLGTNLGGFLTFLIRMMAHHQLFWPIFTIFGVKCPFFHG